MSENKKTAFEQAQQEQQAGILKEFFLFLRHNKKYLDDSHPDHPARSGGPDPPGRHGGRAFHLHALLMAGGTAAPASASL